MESTHSRAAGLGRFPVTIHALQARWALSLGEPRMSDAIWAWVAPGGLRFWGGRPTVRLLEADTRLPFVGDRAFDATQHLLTWVRLREP